MAESDDDYHSPQEDYDEEDEESEAEEPARQDAGKQLPKPRQRKPGKKSQRSLPSTKRPKDQRIDGARRCSSDESSYTSEITDSQSDSQTSRSVLGEISQNNHRARRVNYVNNMAGLRKGTQEKRAQALAAEAARKAVQDAKKAAASKKRTSSGMESDEESTTGRSQFKKLKKELEDRSKSNRALRSENHDLRSEVTKLNGIIVELRDENSNLKKTKVRGGVPLNADFKHIVEKLSRTYVWKEHKFIANQEQLDKVMLKVMMKTDHGREALKGQTKEEKQATSHSYALTYGKFICPIINGRRSTVQQQLQKAFIARAKEGSYIPPPAKFLQIIRRKGLNYKIKDGETEPTPENKTEVDRNRDVFDWYSDVLVPKAVGISNWGPNQKYHGHLATYAPPDDPDHPYVNAGGEAFVPTCYENCGVKWPYIFRCIAKGKDVDVNHSKMDTYAFSNRKAGTDCFGGWSEDGRIRYREIRSMISK